MAAIKYPLGESNPCLRTENQGTRQRKAFASKDLSQAENQGAAFGAAAEPETVAIDPDLQAVVAAWPDLPEAIRGGIAAMVKAAGDGAEG